MGQRVGFGATVATAILFSTLLSSNFIVLFGADQREKFAVKANGESFLYDNEMVIAGTESLNLLDAVQGQLASAPFPCDGLPQAIANRLGVSTRSQSAGTLVVSSALSLPQGIRNSSDLSTLRPFNGTEKGMLNLSVSTSANGSVPGIGVFFQRTEVQYAHLPFRIDAIGSFCAESERIITNDLTAETVGGCNATQIDTLVRALQVSLAGIAESQGLMFQLSYSLSQSPKCQISFVSLINQVGIAGPLGAFTAGAEGAGSVTLPG